MALALLQSIQTLTSGFPVLFELVFMQTVFLVHFFFTTQTQKLLKLSVRVHMYIIL